MGVEDEAAHKAEAGFESCAAGSPTLGALYASSPLSPPPPPPQLKEAAELCALIVLERARGAGLGGRCSAPLRPSLTGARLSRPSWPGSIDLNLKCTSNVPDEEKCTKMISYYLGICD